MNARITLAASIALVFSGCSGGDATPPSPGSTQQSLAGPVAPSGLDYVQGRPVYRAGRAIAPNTASVSGTNLAYSVQPALPAGLVLDAATGTITGAPTATAPTAVYVVTATNPNGSTSASLRITVLPFHQALEDAQFGNATSVRLLGAVWGRLVDVYDQDLATGASRRIARDLLVRADAGNGAIYQVTTNVATQGTRITILAPLGSSAFANAYDALEANLEPIAPVGLDALPPFSVVPRNAAIALLFDDLVDPSSIRSDTVRALSGVPAAAVQSARLLADPNHGNVSDTDTDGHVEFWSTRVIVDPVVTSAEALADAQPIQPDPDGFPAAGSSAESNVLVRIPTIVDAGVGQLDVLRNLSGAAVSSAQSGPIDPSSPTVDVVRALRSGGPTAITGDAYEGFLEDQIRPQIVAEIPVSVSGVTADPFGNPEDKRVDVHFQDSACAASLRPGDTLQVGRAVMEVLETSTPPVGLDVAGVRVKILQRTTLLTGAARLHVRLDLILDQARFACFLAFDPPAGVAPAGAVNPESRVILRADEALAPASLSGMDETRITRVPDGFGGREVVPANHEPAADLRGVAIRPLVPLTHANSVSEPYYVRIANWADLAGNVLTSTLSAVQFDLDTTAPSVASGGVTFRFDSGDMLPGAGVPPDAGSNRPEFRGQFLYDFAAGTANARPVSRFQAAADRTQAVPSLMIPFGSGVPTPISRYGSKLQSIWRYCDFGMGLLDEQFQNVDVEHLYWSPVGGTPIADTVPRFEIALTHGLRLPDESLDANLLPLYPNSGLLPTYAQNVADPVNDPLRTVHPGAHGTPGYVVQPSDATITPSGTTLMPWPLNRGIPLDEYARYTWRDTGLLARGAPNGPGAELRIVNIANGQSQLPSGVPYAPNNVPTIGLPLLMEFRCYPDDATSGVNRFDISLAVASSARPNLRAFSTGGISTSGAVFIDPDLQTTATGGFNPNSLPTPGAATLPTDNTSYVGAMDLVVRVSRMHSIWLDSEFAAPQWSVAVEPSAAQQPASSELQFAYRGANAVAQSNLSTDATTLDAYGEARSGTQPAFFNNELTWKSLGALNGARFLQTRVTFVANAATNRTPALAALGIAWR